MRSSETVFVSPDYDIDSRIYFSDINISKKPLYDEYESLYSQGRYSDALSLIEDEDFYGAWLLNLLENRLFNMENYIWDIEKPHFGTYQDTEPDFTEEPDDTYIWVNSGLETPIAYNVPYDNTNTGIPSDNVQQAIDELFLICS